MRCLKLDTPSDSPHSSQGLAVAEAAAALKPADAAPAAVSKKRPAEGDAGADEDDDGERYSNNYWSPQPDAQTVSDGQSGGFDCLIAEVDTANEDRYLVEGASCAM